MRISTWNQASDFHKEKVWPHEESLWALRPLWLRNLRFNFFLLLTIKVFIFSPLVIIFNSHNKLFQYASTDMDRVSFGKFFNSIPRTMSQHVTIYIYFTHAEKQPILEINEKNICSCKRPFQGAVEIHRVWPTSRIADQQWHPRNYS